MMSGSADNTLRLWSAQTGKNLFTWEFPTAVKCVAFNDDGTQVVCITEQRMGYQCAIRVFKINRDGDGTDRESLIFPVSSRCYLTKHGSEQLESKEPLYFFNPIGSKATVCAFTNAPNVIFTGHESGKVALFDVKSGEELNNNERAHSDTVTDLQLSNDRTYCITSSKDKSARVSVLLEKFMFNIRLISGTDSRLKIHDIKTLQVLKTFTTETPLNSASIMPSYPYVSSRYDNFFSSSLFFRFSWAVVKRL